MAWVMTTSGAVMAKAGAHVASTVSGAALKIFEEDAEAYINALTRYDLTANWASLNSNTRGVISEAVSNLAAMYAIQYDMSGFTSRIEAEDMINVLWARFSDCALLLRDQKIVTFLNNG